MTGNQGQKHLPDGWNRTRNNIISLNINQLNATSPTTHTYHHLNVRHHTPLFFTRPYLARLPHNSDKNPQHKRGNPPVFYRAQILS